MTTVVIFVVSSIVGFVTVFWITKRIAKNRWKKFVDEQVEDFDKRVGHIVKDVMMDGTDDPHRKAVNQALLNLYVAMRSDLGSYDRK